MSTEGLHYSGLNAGEILLPQSYSYGT